VIKIDISSIPDGESAFDLSEDPSDLGMELEGGSFESRVEVNLDVNRNGDEVFLKGKARVRAILECGRCLKEYSHDLETPLQLWCRLSCSETEGGTLPERENVIELAAGQKYIELTDHVRSELLVVVPLKPLCREDCKGLCPKCGADLNIRKCSCQNEEHDSRWDALKKLK
jgi:uncharacterized protein